ncbi:uncharacterized protein LOC112045215 [Bicyclus anynana]|uniref:Uncharacterized protein LOC112045215 n=1 Tax=Bicyclus anynana TaxID=110368 RepID=A0ABM3LQ38_BICAN|nr:uncharacterized protein LOC112045215 [Bicyclus anynana]
MKQVIILAIFILKVQSDDDSGWAFVGAPLAAARPCNGSNDISLSFEPGHPPEEENQYNLFLNKKYPAQSKIILKFDTGASITLHDKSFARVSSNPDNSFTIRFFKANHGVGLTVKGLIPGVIPYLTSVKINTREYCSKPLVGVLDSYLQGYQDTAETPDLRPKENCGRRRVTHTELIVNGALTKPGDWPWHVALYRIDHSTIKYICGGTLISKNHVLTAAHCTTIRGVPVLPETLSVVLGKFNLIGGDTESQEREVYSIIIYEQFDHRLLENDIALVKLKSEAVFNDYIQPACLWYPKAVERLPGTEIFGTIVGWGFENTDALAPQLRKAKMPIVSESTCLKSNPVFYSRLLKNNNKFCAGYRNGTSACNGDSGSAFQVFLPDTAKDDNPDAVGSWYVRGIVSVTLSRVDAAICNPEQYVVFTDVEKYKNWIEKHINNKMKKVILYLMILCCIEIQCVEESKIFVPTYNTNPCNGSEDIKISYDSNVSKEEQYQYNVLINKTFTKNSRIVLTLSSDSTVTLKDPSFARVYPRRKTTFEIRVFKLHSGLIFNVQGQIPKTVPQIKSLIINNKEHCRHPLLRYFETQYWENKDYIQNVYRKSEGTCGRRKVVTTKYLQGVSSTKPGDWPWHAAIYKHDNTEMKYICGGTLISNKYVLTAAQCSSSEGYPFVPETLSVFLGKFNLVGGDEGSQEKVVNNIIIHENFNYRNLDNDISLLKLKTDVEFSNYVQPACLWYNKAYNYLQTGDVFGTLVGWGFDTTDSWSPHLQQVQLPMVPERVCLQSNPRAYSGVLNSNKFCAGYGVGEVRTRGQGTSNCNGDSGTAFEIFIPDNVRDKGTDAPGTWYVRGIVSLTVPLRDSPACDPNQYVVFTDVNKYKDWIDYHLKY